MRLGIGGRAFGVRGGISTRGIGVGVGPLSAGTSWRGRRSRRSSRGGGAALIVALVIGGFSSMCHHDSQPSASIGQGTPGHYQPMKTAGPPPAGTCPEPLNDTATPASSSKSPITLPDLTGLNAQVAEDQLKHLNLKAMMSSANPKYSMVLSAKNWEVVSMYPPAGCTVPPYGEVSLKVTKP